MAEWSLVAARDRKQCEEVPAERRPASLGGVNARLRLSGPFVSPPPDWTSQIRWNTIRRRGRLYRNLPPPPPSFASRLFSLRNELWSRGGPIGCSTPLCAGEAPRARANRPEPRTGRSVKAERSQGACLHDRCLDTKNSSGREQQGEACSRGNLYASSFPAENGRSMSRYLVGSTGRREWKCAFNWYLFPRLWIYCTSRGMVPSMILKENFDDIDNQIELGKRKLE